MMGAVMNSLGTRVTKFETVVFDILSDKFRKTGWTAGERRKWRILYGKYLGQELDGQSWMFRKIYGGK